MPLCTVRQQQVKDFTPLQGHQSKNFVLVILPSCFPPHKKNDQKNSRGASMTTGQTIASPTHINISSPISEKNLSRNRRHFPKNLSHLDLNCLVPPILLKECTRLQMRQVRQVRQRWVQWRGRTAAPNSLRPLGEPIYFIKTIHRAFSILMS